VRASPKFAAGLHNAELRKNVRRNHLQIYLDIPRLSYPVGGQSAVALDFPVHYILACSGNGSGAGPGVSRVWRLIRENLITALG
jgi:hypothetical protein